MLSRRTFLQSALLLPAALTVASARAQQPAPGTVPAQAKPSTEVFADFEGGTYDGWTIEGDAFGAAPATDALFPGQIGGYAGRGFLCSLHPRKGNAATGKATSREFTVEKPFIRFKIGGGNHPGEACMNLVVDGQTVRTATGNDTPVLSDASWDVSDLAGKKAHLEVVDSTGSADHGYIMVDDITFSSFPHFHEQVRGQNSFLCFGNEDKIGQAFQKIFSSPEGQQKRALTDICADRLTADLSVIANTIDRNNIEQCKSALHSVVAKTITAYQVDDMLSKGMIAANASSILTAMLTQYDPDLADFIEHKADKNKNDFKYIVEMRRPATVLQRGKAVCGGISGLEQEFGSVLKEFGVECYNVAGHTRRGDLTPIESVNHSWTTYSFCGGRLWASSDTTHYIALIANAQHHQLLNKISRSSIVVVDPLLRDIFNLFHYSAGWKIGYPDTEIKEAMPNLLEYAQWSALNTSYHDMLVLARSILKQAEA